MTEKIKVKVFADYGSTGVWMPDGCNANPTELGISPGLQLALKYWHEMWEFTIENFSDEEYLQARIAEVSEILASLSEDDVMGRMSFEGEHDNLLQELQYQSEPIVSKDYVERWRTDGYELARLMSAENDKYEFVFLK